jgi:hypothetical protein
MIFKHGAEAPIGRDCKRQIGLLRLLIMENAPSRAKAYFEQIRSQGLDFLNALVGSQTPTFESEFLEFKGAFSMDLRNDDLLELWAKNLSGFANSDGGVLIFGIDAPKGAAKSFSPVQDVMYLFHRLKNTTPTVTEPPVHRVEIEPYPDKGSPNKGFVVCHIPPSAWKPHQAKVGGQPGQFYMRVSDNHIPCNYATLRALFYPQFVSVIEISHRIILKPNNIRGCEEIALRCWIHNMGPATAREAFVMYSSNEISKSPFLNNGLWVQSPDNPKVFMARRSIHPTEEQLWLCDFPIGTKTDRNYFEHSTYTCRLSIFANNQDRTEFEIEISPEDVTWDVIRKANPV